MPTTLLREILRRHGTVHCGNATVSLADEGLAADIARLAYRHRHDLSRHIRWIPADASEENLADRLMRHVHRFNRGQSLASIIYAISNAAGEPVGMLNLQPRGSNFEFGFWLIPEARGQRLLSQIIGAFVLLLACHFPKARFIIRTDASNVAATRVALAANFHLENGADPILTFVKPANS